MNCRVFVFRVKTAGKKTGEYSGNFEVQNVISGAAMASASLISHGFDEDETQRRGVTFTAFEVRMMNYALTLMDVVLTMMNVVETDVCIVT